ncbi:thiopurine S-methyltransferase [Hyphomicrobium methylovorum]|uniref:thiopurine S-methyltransferase n=1 Tax=Hyphomicrobium methylovorum TaxID=84 RepID=UPI0015E7997D|nr:thiopurine S-methyltransferase [Hyphomicrobium methylovorum]MBA2126026.1 thiopurine S-methyltransferase [Hyphomicrobium methylovorum]
MDKAFWDERWQRRDIGFHQPHIHEQLQRFWPDLGLPVGSSVFVPLAGKSRDMVWLAAQGHRIVGIELSEIAIREFFLEGGQQPEQSSDSPFDIYSVGPFRLYRGDFFDLTASALQDVHAVYDRAALIALPADKRRQYADKLAALIPVEAKILLIGLSYPENEMSGPPFSVPKEEVERLYGKLFDISVLNERERLEFSPSLKRRGVTSLIETAYLLKRK